MRTARVLTVSHSMLCARGGVCSGGVWTRGVYLVPEGLPGKGAPGLGGVSGPRGVYLVPGGGVCPQRVPGPGGCTWSWGVSGTGGGVYPGRCTWSQGELHLVPAGGVRYSPL